MERKDKITSAELGESSLLIENRAAGDFSARFGELVDSFESIQARRILLSHEINGCICSLAQRAQDLVVIEARRAIGRFGIDGANSSLRKGE